MPDGRHLPRIAIASIAAKRTLSPSEGSGDDHVRDFVGYGPNPPDPRWPGGARLALNFVVNVEEGSEASVPEGDGRSEFALTELAGSDPGIKGRALAAEGMFEYGSRVGLWPIMRLSR